VKNIFDQTDDDATPLTPEEMRDLIPAHIADRDDLNEAEQANIVLGQAWALRRRRDILNEKFTRELHKRTLGEVWRWAGNFRRTERNLGIPFFETPVTLRQLLHDAKAWIESRCYPPDEIAVCFHHRLVQIHPFVNGNGRHSRLMADLVVMDLGRDRFTWGSAHLRSASEVRARYVAALKAADNYDIEPLLKFARS
jgi:Fic-DOC domain mobile mystery protein B